MSVEILDVLRELNFLLGPAPPGNVVGFQCVCVFCSGAGPIARLTSLLEPGIFAEYTTANASSQNANGSLT